MPSSTWASACSALIFCFALFYYIYFVLCHLQVQGEWQLTVGSQGDQPGQFNSPVGLALSPDDAFLLVADSSNQRVAVLRATDGAWVRALTGPPGTLECPWYVTWCPRRGRCLSRTSILIKWCVFVPSMTTRWLAGHGSSPTQLNRPTGLAVLVCFSHVLSSYS